MNKRQTYLTLIGMISTMRRARRGLSRVGHQDSRQSEELRSMGFNCTRVAAAVYKVYAGHYLKSPRLLLSLWVVEEIGQEVIYTHIVMSAKPHLSWRYLFIAAGIRKYLRH